MRIIPFVLWAALVASLPMIAQGGEPGLRIVAAENFSQRRLVILFRRVNQRVGRHLGTTK